MPAMKRKLGETDVVQLVIWSGIFAAASKSYPRSRRTRRIPQNQASGRTKQRAKAASFIYLSQTLRQ